VSTLFQQHSAVGLLFVNNHAGACFKLLDGQLWGDRGGSGRVLLKILTFAVFVSSVVKMLNMFILLTSIILLTSVDSVRGKPNFIIMLMDDVSYKHLHSVVPKTCHARIHTYA